MTGEVLWLCVEARVTASHLLEMQLWTLLQVSVRKRYQHRFVIGLVCCRGVRNM